MIAYSYEITPDGTALLIRFPDVPEAITFADSRSEVVTRGRDALESALVTYVESRRRLPQPSSGGAGAISVSALAEAKLALYGILLDRSISEQDLAGRLNLSDEAVHRLLDLRVETPLTEIEDAFRALDRKLTIQVVDAA